MRTINPQEIEEVGSFRTDSAQKPAGSESQKVKFPKVIRHRRVEAKIYGRSKSYPFYRLAYRVAGKRRVRHFKTYSEAKTEADRTLRDLANGSQAAALNANQSRDALVALERLQSLYQSTGQRVSLLAAVSEFAEASAKLNGHPLGEAVNGYLHTVATVKRRDIKEAVEEFLQPDASRTKAINGQRAELSAKYAYNRQIQLRKFADTFPNTAICDLTREHLDTFFGSLGGFSAKSRNHYRAAVRQLLQWAVRKDYLAATHRLADADGLRPERANTSEIAFYTPRELAVMLETADETLQPLIAIGGLAGLRTAELLRLDWADVRRVPGHIEITSGKSKTRQRRLVEICPALAAWLVSFSPHERGKLWVGHEVTFQQKFAALCKEAKVPRKANGLRHSFCTYHFASHQNENLTAALAGNSPAMIHGHYKGLATKTEAGKWFSLKPSRTGNVIALPSQRIASR